VDFIWTFGDDFIYPDTDHAAGVIMLLLASYLAGMTSGAIFILDK
jgi:hypothetical protein